MQLGSECGALVKKNNGQLSFLENLSEFPLSRIVEKGYLEKQRILITTIPSLSSPPHRRVHRVGWEATVAESLLKLLKAGDSILLFRASLADALYLIADASVLDS